MSKQLWRNGNNVKSKIIKFQPSQLTPCMVIFTYIYHHLPVFSIIKQPHVGKYTVHEWYGTWQSQHHPEIKRLDHPQLQKLVQRESLTFGHPFSWIQGTFILERLKIIEMIIFNPWSKELTEAVGNPNHWDHFHVPEFVICLPGLKVLWYIDDICLSLYLADRLLR